MALTLTAANAVLLIGINGIFPTPQQLQGFAADDITDIDAIEPSEAAMGVDGILSAGFVFVAVKQTIMLQADSPSNLVFDTWYNVQFQLQDLFFANGTLILPGVKTKWTQTKGTLTSYKPAPTVKRTLQPRHYEITWQTVQPAASTF